ncbi:MAG: hypothetical protein IJ620_01550 [Bacteroidales bacterium]|nr:hypothetical protein [Bacteroidales bacterium]
MKKSIITIILLLAIVAPAQRVSAQGLERNDLLYHAQSVPQSNQLNPAFYQKYRSAYITLPSFNISMGMPISYSEIGFQYDQENDKYRINLYDLSEKLENNQSIHFGTNIELFGFGFRTNKLFFNFSASAQVDLAFYFPEGLTNILHEGLADRIGAANAAEINASQFLHASAYERYSIGMGYIVNDHLSIGGHFNLLNGVVNLNLEDTRIRLYATDDAYSTIHGDVNYRLARAGALNLDFENHETEFAHSFGNTGFTFDLGASYKTDGFTFSASLIDVGPGIHWKENIYYTEPKRTTIDFDGSNFGSLINDGQVDNEFAGNVVDTLAALLDIKDREGSDYWYGVPTKLFIGASYDINNYIRAGLLYHGEWDRGIVTAGKGFDLGRGHFRSNLSLSANFNLAGWLELMMANAFVFDGKNGSLFNPGIGLTFSPANTVQLYVMADFISSFYAVEAKAMNAYMGFNVRFGKNRDKKTEGNDEAALIQIEPAQSTPDPTNANGSSEPIVF